MPGKNRNVVVGVPPGVAEFGELKGAVERLGRDLHSEASSIRSTVECAAAPIS